LPFDEHDQFLSKNATTKLIEMAENYLKLKMLADKRMAIAVTKALREIHASRMETVEQVKVLISLYKPIYKPIISQ
jgi:hypothetical protein